MKYSGENFLYFFNGGPYDNPLLPPNLYYTSVVEFSFWVASYQVDTFHLNKFKPNLSIIPLTIQAEGRVVGEKRKVYIQIEGDGKEFCVLPHPDSLYIPANATAIKLNLGIVRPPITDTTTKSFTVKLMKDELSSEKHTWNKVKYIFGNRFVAPIFYGNSTAIFGMYSRAKFQAIQTAVSGAGSALWVSDANFALLNALLPEKAERKFDMDSFSMNELYRFMDIVKHFASGSGRSAFNAIARKIKTITTEYLLEMKNAGTPVLDDSGLPVDFSN